MQSGRIVVASPDYLFPHWDEQDARKRQRGRRLLARKRLHRAAWQVARLHAPERPEQTTAEIVREYLTRCAEWTAFYCVIAAFVVLSDKLPIPAPVLPLNIV